jgi:NitT/TauT family transport system permease protein
MNCLVSWFRKLADFLFYNVGPIVVLLVIWESVVRFGVVRALFLPAFSDVLVQFWKITINGDLISEFAVTLRRMVVGFAAGAGSAIVFGLTIGLYRGLRRFFYPIVAAIYPLPKIALLSLFLVAFGDGDPPIIASVAVAAFFPVLLNTLTGLQSIDPILIRAAHNLGASKFQTTLKVVLPGALPMIFTGLRQSSAIALLIVVAVEMYIGQTGVGHALSWATQFFDVKTLYSYIIAIAIFGILLFRLFDVAERYLVPWAAE